MLSYHNDIAVKEKYLSRVRAHALADEIVKGKYWEGGKGCAVGCTVHSSNHGAYETELGLPTWLARLEDRLFEGMSNDKAKTFPQKFLEAIPVGANLEPIKWKMAVFILNGLIDLVGALKITEARKNSVLEVIRGSIAVNQNAIDTGVWDFDAAAKARSAADAADAAYAAAAAADAAYAAAAAAAADASAYAYAYAYAAAAAADSAAAAAYAYAYAKRAVYDRYADELLRLLADLKPVEGK